MSSIPYERIPGLAFPPGLERLATNRGDLSILSLAFLFLFLVSYWSWYLVSKLRQPSMVVSVLARGSSGMNACSAGPLPPIDSTVVRLQQCLESEEYTIASGA